MKKNLNAPADFIDPLAELGYALAAKRNEIEGYRKYGYDPETDTIISESGTGLHFTTHLEEILRMSPVN